MNREEELREIYESYTDEKLIDVIDNPDEYQEIVLELVKKIINEHGGLKQLEIRLEKKYVEEEIKKMKWNDKKIKLKDINTSYLTLKDKDQIVNKIIKEEKENAKRLIKEIEKIPATPDILGCAINLYNSKLSPEEWFARNTDIFFLNYLCRFSYENKDLKNWINKIHELILASNKVPYIIYWLRKKYLTEEEIIEIEAHRL